MDSIAIEILGLIAGAITSIGFIPQILKSYRTKKLNDISYFMPAILALGMTIWLIYGLFIGAIAVIVANIVGVACNVILIIMKKKYT